MTVGLLSLSPLISRITGGTQDWMVMETLRYLPFFALHRLVVARVPFLRLLFNGRPMSARVPAA